MSEPRREIAIHCNQLRAECLALEKKVRALPEHPDFVADTNDNFGEMQAQKMLAVRHLEDARMRLGKVIQYAEGGVSILDK
jgi:hypothetical protein